MPRIFELLPFGRRALVACATLLAVGATSFGTTAVPVKGRLSGHMKLLNPVWDELRDPDARSYTFREPSPTVKAEYRKLFPYIPKEVCVALVGATEQPKIKKVEMRIGGGRTTPVTLVVTPGTEITFSNTDPFPHRLYAEGVKTFGPGDTKAGGNRVWTVPEAGVYEIRDELVPSLRTWIVADPKVAAFGYPDVSGAFSVDLPVVGEFEVQVYFAGEQIGKSAMMNITKLNQPIDLSKAPIKLEAKPPKKPAKEDEQPEDTGAADSKGEE